MLLAIAAVLLPGAAAGQATGTVKYDRNLIIAEEIQARAPDAKTAYDVIRLLRPQFLRTRGSTSIQSKEPIPVKVYVDGSYRGEPYVLRELRSDAIVEIVYLDASSATTRFGTGHDNGAIMVKLGRTAP